MRALLLPVLLLAAASAACDRSAPAQSQDQAASALPPPAGSHAAQSVPAGGMPAPAAGVNAKPPVAGAAKSPATAPAAAADARKPAATAKTPRTDPRWRDVDPDELEVPRDAAVAAFEEEQRKRDAELMARDAAEASGRRARSDRDDGPARRPREYPPQYEDDGYAQGPEERYPPEDYEPRSPYEDEDPYAREDRVPYPYGAEPAPYGDEVDPYDPGYEDDHDPRYEDDYRR